MYLNYKNIYFNKLLNSKYIKTKKISHYKLYSLMSADIKDIINVILSDKNIYPSIIVSSTQYPGYGGAATNAYKIIKYLRENNYNTIGIFFHNKLDVNFDPENIGGIFLYKYSYNKKQIIIDTISYLKSIPNICFAKNYMAPYFCKEIFKCYTVYLVSGINYMNYYLPKSAQDVLKDDIKIDKKYLLKEEIKANNDSDLIVLNSVLSKQLFLKAYQEFENKIYPYIIDTSDYNVLTKNISNINYEKEYDILICCSNLDRQVKNNLFLIDVLMNEKFDDYKKCIIGEKYDQFIKIPNSTCMGLISNEETLIIMKKSKILLFPSLFDANPNTVREATKCGCLPLITKNIGYYENYPDNQICETFDIDEWQMKIINLLNIFNKLSLQCL